MKQRSTLTHAHFIFLVPCAAIIISLSTAIFGQGNSGNGNGNKPPIVSLGPANLPYWKLIGNSVDSAAFAGTANNFPFKIKVNNVLRASFTNSGMDLDGNLHSEFATVDSILTTWRVMVNDALSANTINAKQYFQNDTLVDLLGIMNSVDNLQSAVSNLSSAQADQQFEINSIQSAITGINDSVSSLSSQVSNLIGTVDTVVLNTVQVNEIFTQSISSDTIYLSGPIMADTVQIPNELKLGDHSLYISGIKTGDPNSSNRIYSRDGDLMVQSIAGNNQNTIIGYGNSGNVGIGTNIAGEKLTVAGNMTVSGNSTIAGNLRLSSLSGNQSNKLLYVDNSGNLTVAPPPPPQDELLCGESPIPWTTRGNFDIGANDYIGTCNNADFAIRTNGDERLRIKSTGNVGIGTNDPLAKLHISHEGNAMRFQRAGFASYDIRQSFNSGLSFVKASNNQVVLHLADTGNVGIGTDNPNEKLDIRGRVQVKSDNYPGIKIINDNTGSYQKATVEFINNNNGQQTGNLSQFLQVNSNGYSSFIMRRRIPDGTYLDYLTFDESEDNNNIIFNASNTSSTPYGDVIVNNGNVGIGTNGPLAKLHVTHEGTAMRFQRTGFASYDIRQSFNSGLSFVKASNNQVVLHLADTGNVGIGTDNPLAKLDIRGKVQVQSDNYPGIQIINENTGANQKATVEFINTNNGQQTGNLSQFLQVNSDGYSSFIMRRRIPDGTYLDYLTFNEKNSNETNNNIILNGAKTSTTPYGDVFVNNGNALIMNGKIGIGLPIPAPDLTNPNPNPNPNPKTSLHIVSNGSATETDIKQSVTNAGILLSSSYSGGVNYLPGLFWSNTNISTDKPAAGIWVKQNGGTDLYLGTGKNGGISSTVVIDQDGKVGIGTSAPAKMLHVGNPGMVLGSPNIPTVGSIRLEGGGNSNNNYRNWDFEVGPTDANTSEYNTHRLRISNNGNEVATIDENGNVGIGTTNPKAKLHIKDGAIKIDDLPSQNAQWWDGWRVALEAPLGYAWKTSNPSSASGKYLGYGITSFNTSTGSREGWYWIMADVNSVVRYPMQLTIENGNGKPTLLVQDVSWADYVFDENYKRPTFEEQEQFFKKHKHLHGIASEKEILEKGVDITGTMKGLTMNVEEMRLDMIELNKMIQEQKRLIEEQKKEIEKLKGNQDK